MGESVEKNHFFVCLPLALEDIHKCCYFLVGRGGGQKVVKCEGEGKVSQKVTNSSKKESDQHSIREKGESFGDQLNRTIFLFVCPWH